MENAELNEDQLDEIEGGTILPYQIRPGDTLGAIAARYHVSVDQLAKWNNIQNPNIIMVGQTLKIKF